MDKTELQKNKRQYIVTLPNNLPRVICNYNPNATKKLYDSKGNYIKTVGNNGAGYPYNIKLVNGEIIILDTEKQDFMINNLIQSGKIQDYEQYLVDQENKQILEDIQKESSGVNEFKTSSKKQVKK